MSQLLFLKFFVNEGISSRLIMSPALLNGAGLYEDAMFVYTEEGKFDKRKIMGEVTVIWDGEEDEDHSFSGLV